MKTFAELGDIVVHAIGYDACYREYGTEDLALIGERALEMGQIDRDGNLTDG